MSDTSREVNIDKGMEEFEAARKGDEIDRGTLRERLQEIEREHGPIEVMVNSQEPSSTDLQTPPISQDSVQHYSFEEAFAILPTGWLTEEEGKLLWECVKGTQGAILEVGCYRGRSTVLMALAGAPRCLYGVDSFSGFDKDLDGEKGIGTLLENLEERKISNVSLFVQRIEDWTPTKVGMAFLDGDHSHRGTVEQISKALLCHPQVIAIHDVNDKGEGVNVRDAALSMLGPWKQRVGSLAVWHLDEKR